MRSSLRTVLIAAAAVVLIVLFLRNVDLRQVGADIAHANPAWLALSFTTFVAIIGIRARRWQFLLAPLGDTSFGNAFRATAIGFAASSVLPARAGEVIRPYFLARQERLSAAGAFATIVIERVLDVVTVLVLLASFVFVFGRDQAAEHPDTFTPIRWAGVMAAAAAGLALALLFVLAGQPAAVDRMIAKIERILPHAFSGFLTRLVVRFTEGLAVVRRPGQLFVALLWSFPLWLTIAVGIWSAAKAFGLLVPFTGAFLMISLLVIGGAVPTPGGIGGFHEAFRVGATTFFGAGNEAAVGAAIVLHAFSIIPALVLGSVFAAQAGLNLGSMRHMADQAAAERPASL
jgi:uncharacterized protein (TIRG00374 family)